MAHAMDTEGRIKAGTVNTPDLDGSVADYEQWLGYRVVERGLVSDTHAAHWQAPAMAGNRYAVMAPASGAPVYIRFVEGTAVPAYKPLMSFGWASLELTIQDCDGLHEQLKTSPFEIIGEPAYLDFSDAIYPMQAVGRAGEVLYLNQVNGSLPDYDLPLAQSPVDHIFITILATPDMQKGVDFYVKGFGWAQGNTYDVPYSVINNAFGFPEDRSHKLSMNCVGRMVNNEVDQYPAETIVRPQVDGELPPGVSMVSFITDSLDAAHTGALGPAVRLEGHPYDGRQSALFRGSAGELAELIQRT